MTTDDHAFGSNELTPELVRGASFDDLDGRYDATEVRTFLDRVASALEVFLADDSRTAMQAEFARNAEIAKQVLDAGLLGKGAGHVVLKVAKKTGKDLRAAAQAILDDRTVLEGLF